MATASSSASSQSVPVSPVRGLIDVFANPAALFERLRDRPDWLIPLLVGAVVFTIVQFFMHPYASRATLGMITDSTPEAMKQGIREAANKPADWKMIFQPITW